jgi:hypothetical protein
MQEAQANLKQAAVEFLEAAQRVAAGAGQGAADLSGVALAKPDPLDRVKTDVFELGDLEPAIDDAALAELKQRLAQERLAPQAIVELVNLARQVAAALL